MDPKSEIAADEQRARSLAVERAMKLAQSLEIEDLNKDSQNRTEHDEIARSLAVERAMKLAQSVEIEDLSKDFRNRTEHDRMRKPTEFELSLDMLKHEVSQLRHKVDVLTEKVNMLRSEMIFTCQQLTTANADVLKSQIETTDNEELRAALQKHLQDIQTLPDRCNLTMKD